MGEVGAAGSLGFCIGSEFIRGKLKRQQQQQLILKSRARSPTGLCRAGKSLVVKSETRKEKPSTYTSRIATDISLYEAPGVMDLMFSFSKCC